MPLPNILRRASTYILGVQSGSPTPPPFTDGEIVFCKNNVCVHPPTLLRQACDIVHHPGYLTIICSQKHNSDSTPSPTLLLSWIPNSTLRRNPWAIEKRMAIPSSPWTEEQGTSVSSTTPTCSSDEVRVEIDIQRKNSADSSGSNGSTATTKSNHRHSPSKPCLETSSQNTCASDCMSPTESESDQKCSHEFSCSCTDRNTNGDESSQSSLSKQLSSRPQTLKYQIKQDELEISDVNGAHSISDCIISPVISVEESQEEEDKSDRTSIITVSRSPSLTSTNSLSTSLTGTSYGATDDIPAWMSSPELLALQHNLTFPESVTASPVVRRTHRCRRFSVDLSLMRSLRLFFNDSACTCGQLVVASRESQYKILHFHHGGLDRLACVLQEWSFLLHSPQPSITDQPQLPYRHFMVCRPEVSKEELHPEEGAVAPLGEEAWLSLLNEDGQIEDDVLLRKSIFFGGLEPSMRRIVWPFLLHCFTFQSTYEEREQIISIRRQEYVEITRRRLEMPPEQQQNFWRNVQCIVEKDVVRTDRSNPFFAGEDNPNIETMKNILLNYAVYNPGFGYTQGMSDLLAPILAEIRNESDTFWCFVGLMQKAIFVCTPTDNDMDRNLSYLRELIHLMVPEVYNHLERHADAMELLFCHRWILLCFKREFPEHISLRIWEACWANYLTDYFHLFLCLAIICIYSDDVIAQDLRTDEMLLYFSSLAMFMDGELILRKARGLLYQFREMPRIPCTLSGLCQLCGPGMWDSTHSPVIECTGQHEENKLCPHRDHH